MTEDELRGLRAALRAELGPIKQMIDNTYSDFARLVAADTARVQAENDRAQDQARHAGEDRHRHRHIGSPQSAVHTGHTGAAPNEINTWTGTARGPARLPDRIRRPTPTSIPPSPTFFLPLGTGRPGQGHPRSLSERGHSTADAVPKRLRSPVFAYCFPW